MVDFAGWELPVYYTGVLEEHRAVRERAGLFDISHMGEIWVRGADAEALLQWLTPNDVAQLEPGRAQYSALLSEAGTYLDDLLVYRFSTTEFLLVVNAANAACDLAWIQKHRRGNTEVEDATDRTALFALQGPRSQQILSTLFDQDLRSLPSFAFLEGEIGGVGGFLSRTGYTGEDGFELYLPADRALMVWEALLDAGRAWDLVPVGLAARDTLRIEAGLMLHGSDIDASVSPLEAGLSWVVKADKGEFIGRAALMAQRRSGVDRKLVGFELAGRRIARRGAPVLDGDERVGSTTSGTWSPTLGKAIGMTLLATECASIGRELEIEIRGRRSPARLVKLPFYRRT